MGLHMPVLADWLAEELKARGWSMRELARRSEISHTLVADVMGGRWPSWDFCAAIARPLGMSPVEIFLIDGRLTVTDLRRGFKQVPNETLSSSERLRYLLADLTPEEQAAFELLLSRRLLD